MKKYLQKPITLLSLFLCLFYSGISNSLNAQNFIASVEINQAYNDITPPLVKKKRVKKNKKFKIAKKQRDRVKTTGFVFLGIGLGAFAIALVLVLLGISTGGISGALDLIGGFIMGIFGLVFTIVGAALIRKSRNKSRSQQNYQNNTQYNNQLTN